MADDQQALSNYCSIMRAILNPCTSIFERHTTALAGSPATQAVAAQLLLEQALPRLAAAAEGQAMDWGSPCNAALVLGALVCAVDAASLRPAVRQRLRQPGGAAIFSQAAGLARAVPVRHGDSSPAYHLNRAHATAAKLLEVVCTALGDIGAAAEGPAGSGQDSAGSTAAGRANQQAAAWEAIGLLPHMAAVVQAMSASSSIQQMQATCLSYAHVVSQLSQRVAISSREQLGTLVAGVEAGLRLLPLLKQLDGSSQQQGIGTGHSDFAYELLSMWKDGCFAAWTWADSSGSAEIGDARAGAAAQLAQLHRRSCRLLHWLAAEGNCAVLPCEGGVEDWMYLQESLSILFCAAGRLGWEEPQPGQRALSG